MLKYLFYILLFVGHISYGQNNKNIELPITKDSNGKIDTLSWYKDYSDLREKINLEDLIKSNDSFHIRFWTDKQAIDIWTLDNKNYFGRITNFAMRFDNKLLKKGLQKIDKIFSKRIILDSTTTLNIYKAFNNLSIGKIPTDGKIKWWTQGFDGEEFLLETSDKENYSFKTYWTPSAHSESIKEAKLMQQFIDYLFIDLKLYDYYDKLKLSKGHFKRNGIQGIQIESNYNTFGARTILDGL